MENCLNCGTELTSNYCPECGQKKISKRMSVKSLFHDFLHSSFHWESTLINTIKDLIISPGNFVHNYIGGKRKSYSSPVSFFVLMLTLFVILFHYFDEEYLKYINETMLGNDRLEKANQLGFDVVAFQHIISSKLNYLYFLLPPIFSGYFLLFFRKIKVNFAEALVFNFYALGLSLLLSTFILLIAFLNFKIWNFKFIITFGYIIYAMVQFSRSGIAAGIFKSIGVVLMGYFTYIFIVVVLVVGYLKFFHH